MESANSMRDARDPTRPSVWNAVDGDYGKKGIGAKFDQNLRKKVDRFWTLT